MCRHIIRESGESWMRSIHVLWQNNSIVSAKLHFFMYLNQEKTQFSQTRDCIKLLINMENILFFLNYKEKKKKKIWILPLRFVNHFHKIRAIYVYPAFSRFVYLWRVNRLSCQRYTKVATLYTYWPMLHLHDKVLD